MRVGPVGKPVGPVEQPEQLPRVARQRADYPQQEAERAQQPGRRARLEKALNRLEQIAYIFDRRFHFKVHEETKRYYVQIIDQATGEVINEVPPEKILDLVAQIQELVGLLIDKRA